MTNKHLVVTAMHHLAYTKMTISRNKRILRDMLLVLKCERLELHSTIRRRANASR